MKKSKGYAGGGKMKPKMSAKGMSKGGKLPMVKGYFKGGKIMMPKGSAAGGVARGSGAARPQAFRKDG
jgi:hypothetical protein